MRDCSTCEYKPKPGTPYEDTPCSTCKPDTNGSHRDTELPPDLNVAEMGRAMWDDMANQPTTEKPLDITAVAACVIMDLLRQIPERWIRIWMLRYMRPYITQAQIARILEVNPATICRDFQRMRNITTQEPT